MLVVDQLRRADRRLQVLAGVMLAGLALLLVGLWYVQIANSRRYQASLKTQTFRTVRVPGMRGKILDRNGLVLAENRPSYNLNLYLDELRPQFEQEYVRQRDRLVRQLAMSGTNRVVAPGFWTGLFGRLQGGNRTVRLTPSQRLDLSAAVRFSVASNAVGRAAALLGQPLAITARDFLRHHTQWPYRPLPVAENLAPADVARILEQGPPIPGLDLDVQPVRYYPQGPVVAHLLGKLRRDDLARDDDDSGFSYSLPSFDGEVGLEYAFNEELQGRSGVRSIVVNSLSYRESESVWVGAEPGQNVHLTLDLGIQRAAYDALRAVSPNVRGAVVVMDGWNGDVLALVSCPSYDPNEFVTGMSPARWQELNDPRQNATFNRATQGAYSPGSTFKIITALACFEAGLDPATRLKVEPDPARPGRSAVYVGRRKIEDTVPPGDYDFIRAFKRSSNSYFIHFGLWAGRERILRIGKAFFLGERVGLPTRQEAGGYFPRPEDVLGLWNDGNLANVCIGQEITVTPLQMAVVTAAIANGGKVFEPRFVSRVEPAEPGVTAPPTNHFAPRIRGTVEIPAPVLTLIRDAMLAETEEPEGTGFAAFQSVDRASGRITPRIPGFRAGGKTGTAEVKQGGRLVDKITWFVAFGPYENPRYAVVVMVESGGSGGGTCAPVAQQVFDHVARRLRPAAAPSPHLASVR